MISDLANIIELLRIFEVYVYIICFFTVRLHVALKLYEALTRYRICLLDFSLIYRFNSVRTYYYTFIGNRILKA